MSGDSSFKGFSGDNIEMDKTNFLFLQDYRLSTIDHVFLIPKWTKIPVTRPTVSVKYPNVMLPIKLRIWIDKNDDYMGELYPYPTLIEPPKPADAVYKVAEVRVGAVQSDGICFTYGSRIAFDLDKVTVAVADLDYSEKHIIPLSNLWPIPELGGLIPVYNICITWTEDGADSGQMVDLDGTIMVQTPPDNWYLFVGDVDATDQALTLTIMGKRIAEAKDVKFRLLHASWR